MRRLLAKAAAALCLAAFIMIPVAAQNISVKVGVGDTIMQVDGRTSPDAFVTISRDGGVIGTTTAGSDGTFSQTFPAQTPGLHELSLFAQTAGGTTTDTVTLTVDVAEHSTTTINVFLPSTLIVTNTSPGYGQPLQLQGETAPSSTVSVYIDSSVYVTTTSGADGQWSLQVNTGALAAGQHSLFVRVTDPFGAQSYPTSLRHFIVAAAPEVPPILTPSAPGPPSVPALPGGPGAPVILQPSNNSIWDQAQLNASGTAGPNVQVELWIGDENAGSVWSDSEGRWIIPLTLPAGDYTLRARACIAGVCSDFSDSIRFMYRPPGLGRPLQVTVLQSAFTVMQNQPLTVQATVEDGSPPYSLVVDWGDGTSDRVPQSRNIYSLTHRYDQPGRYSITLEVTDSQGRNDRVFLTALVQPAFPLWPLLAILLVLALALLGWWVLRRGTPSKTRDNEKS